MVYGVVGCRFGSLEAAQIGGGVIEVVNQILCGNFWLNITSKFWTNMFEQELGEGSFKSKKHLFVM